MGDEDPIDDRLREYAGRWRDALPVPSPRRRREPAMPWWPAAAASLAVIAISVTLAVTARDGDDSTPSTSPASTSRAAGVVPWADLQPTYPSIAATTPPASPDPSVAEAVPACTGNDISLTPADGGAAGGTSYTHVEVRLVGADRCRLDGPPRVEPLDHGRPLAVPVEDEPIGLAGNPAGPVVLTRATPVQLTIGHASDAITCPATQNDRIRVTLAGRSVLVPGFGHSRCEQGVETVKIEVFPIGPTLFAPARVSSAYDDVVVTDDLGTTVPHGQPLSFTVTLTSPKDLVLSPCPDYSITIGEETGRHALACAAVPYRDPSGEPYLPAGVPVTFAMQGRAPGSTGTEKFSWQLQAPSPVGTDSLVTLD